jgi:ribosomal protein S18 acetylase RimI-like enzyme
MNNTVEIIHCDFENESHCAALVRLMSEYISDKMGGGVPYTEEQKVKLLDGLKNHPSKMVLLAKDGGDIVGLCNGFINFATFTVKPYINIHDVIVTNTYRNKGVGRKLLESLVEKAGEIGCSKVTLEVREDNHNARHLYNVLGFYDAEPKQYYWSKCL